MKAKEKIATTILQVRSLFFEKLTISLILRNSFSIKFYHNAFSVQKLNQNVDTET